MMRGCAFTIMLLAALSASCNGEAAPRPSPIPTPQLPSAPINNIPTTGAIQVSPSFSGSAIAGVSEFALGVPDAADADGDQLTIQWDFGDGTVTTGRLVRKIYIRGGTYRVEVAVSDDKGGKALTNTSLQVADLDGRWSNNDGATTRVFELSQRGSSINGTYIRNSSASGSLSGSLTPPHWMDLFTGIPGDISIQINRAQISDDVSSFTGYIYRNGRIDSALLTWTRQR